MHREDIRKALTVAANRIGGGLNRGDEYFVSNRRPGRYPDWFFDPKLGGVLNHVSRGHIAPDCIAICSLRCSLRKTVVLLYYRIPLSRCCRTQECSRSSEGNKIQ